MRVQLTVANSKLKVVGEPNCRLQLPAAGLLGRSIAQAVLIISRTRARPGQRIRRVPVERLRGCQLVAFSGIQRCRFSRQTVASYPLASGMIRPLIGERAAKQVQKMRLALFPGNGGSRCLCRPRCQPLKPYGVPARADLHVTATSGHWQRHLR